MFSFHQNQASGLYYPFSIENQWFCFQPFYPQTEIDYFQLFISNGHFPFDFPENIEIEHLEAQIIENPR